MKFVSTHNETTVAGLAEALMGCLAEDGGLFIPAETPVLPRAFYNNISELTLPEIAYVVASSFFGSDIRADALKKIVDRAFAFPMPLQKPAAPGEPYVLELFHGSTYTVKDSGALFMAGLVAELYSRIPECPQGKRRKVLLSSSGNSAIAVAAAFRHMDDIDFYLVCPHGALTRRRQAVLAGLGKNIIPVEVSGTIDDCNAIVRSVIADARAARDITVSGANSINIGRVIPTVVFFLYAYSRISATLGEKQAAKAIYSVPCGNMSTLTGAVLAAKMGMPMGGIVAACVQDETLTAYTSDTAPQPAANQSRLATASNVRRPANLPRLATLCGGHERLGQMIAPRKVDDEEIASVILRYRREFGIWLNPHSALAVAAAKTEAADAPVAVALATAHPAVAHELPETIVGETMVLPGKFKEMVDAPPLKHWTPIRIAPTKPALLRVLNAPARPSTPKNKHYTPTL